MKSRKDGRTFSFSFLPIVLPLQPSQIPFVVFELKILKDAVYEGFVLDVFIPIVGGVGVIVVTFTIVPSAHAKNIV